MLITVVFVVAALAAGTAQAYPGGNYRPRPPVCNPWQGICDRCTEGIDLPSCINVSPANLDGAGAIPDGWTVSPANLDGAGAIPDGWTITGDQIVGGISPALIDTVETPFAPFNCQQDYGVPFGAGPCAAGGEPGFCKAVGTCLPNQLRSYDEELSKRTSFCASGLLVGDGMVDPRCWSLQTIGCSMNVTAALAPGNYFGQRCVPTPDSLECRCPGVGATCRAADGDSLTTGAGICIAIVPSEP